MGKLEPPAQVALPSESLQLGSPIGHKLFSLESQICFGYSRKSLCSAIDDEGIRKGANCPLETLRGGATRLRRSSVAMGRCWADS